MAVLAYLAVALVAFVVLAVALGLLPVLLCVHAVRKPGSRPSTTLRVLQSNIALLAVLAAVGIYLGIQQLISSHGAQPLFLGLTAAGVAIAPTSIATYVWLERQIP